MVLQALRRERAPPARCLATWGAPPLPAEHSRLNANKTFQRLYPPTRSANTAGRHFTTGRTLAQDVWVQLSAPRPESANLFSPSSSQRANYRAASDYSAKPSTYLRKKLGYSTLLGSYMALRLVQYDLHCMNSTVQSIRTVLSSIMC